MCICVFPDQHARSVEEQAKRMAAEEASKTKNMFLSHMSHELYVLLPFVCESAYECVSVVCVCMCIVCPRVLAVRVEIEMCDSVFFLFAVLHARVSRTSIHACTPCLH